MRKGTYAHRNGVHRLIEYFPDDKSWRIFRFSADNSNISSLKEYDEIEYELGGDNSIIINKTIGENKKIDNFFNPV